MRTPGFWPPSRLTRPTPGSCDDLLGEPGVDHIVHLGQRLGLGGDGQGQHRRVGGIDLGVDRRRGQIGRQQIAGGVDRRLDLLLRDVEAELEGELQRDGRGASRADRGHLVEAGHLAELALERRRDRRGHDLRAGAGIERLDADGRIVDLRQGRQRQEFVGDHADQHDRDHQQRGSDRPFDEDPRRVHVAAGVTGSTGWRQHHWPAAVAAAAPCASGGADATGGPERRARMGGRPAADLGAVAQTVGAVDDDLVADLQALRDLHPLAVARSQLDDPDLHGIVGLDEVDEGSRLAALDGGDRNHRRILDRVDQQPDVHELVGEQVLVLVVEDGAQTDRAGRGVDHVVMGVELADGELALLGAVEHPRLEEGPRLQPLAHRRQRILRNGEDHRDRLHLDDDADAGGVAHGHIVALVDQAQADASGQGRHDLRIGDVQLGGIDLGLVDHQRRLVLADQRHLRVVLLPGDESWATSFL